MVMVFSLCQVLEKYLKQNRFLYAVFIDFTKALDKVSRQDLYIFLRNFSSTNKMINLIRPLQDEMLKESRQIKLQKNVQLKKMSSRAALWRKPCFQYIVMLTAGFKDVGKGAYIRHDTQIF